MKLTEKQKYYGLLGSLPFLLLLLYVSIISKTLHTMEQVDRLEADMLRTEGISSDAEILAAETERLERIVKQAEMRDSSDILFTQLTDYCAHHRILLRSYSPAHITTQQNYRCYTRIVLFEGSFRHLLYLTDYLENKEGHQLKSLSFDVVPERGKQPAGLRLKLYIQFIKTVAGSR